jgi:DNA-binding NarL/FixJ family response regulator
LATPAKRVGAALMVWSLFGAFGEPVPVSRWLGADGVASLRLAGVAVTGALLFHAGLTGPVGEGRSLFARVPVLPLTHVSGRGDVAHPPPRMGEHGETTTPPTVLVADDHRTLAAALVLLLDTAGLSAVTASDPHQVVAEAERLRPAVVLLDLRLGDGTTSVDHIPALVALGCRVLVLTGVTDPVELGRALEAGAAGIVPKTSDPDTVVTSVRNTLAGLVAGRDDYSLRCLDELRAARRRRQERYAPFERLTAREAAVLADMMRGLPADAISEAHYVSLATVRSQIRAVLQKLGVNSQLAAVAMAHRSGWSLDRRTEPAA